MIEKDYYEGETFTDIDFTKNDSGPIEYEGCIFQGCSFQEADLSECVFSECVFENCDLSMIECTNTSFRDIRFIESKVTGVNFENVNTFGFLVYFENSVLDFSSFNDLVLIKTEFIKTSCVEVDFSNCDLSNALFENCDLSNAVFENTNLKEADLSTAENCVIDPQTNNIRKATFALSQLPSLLKSYDIKIEYDR